MTDLWERWREAEVECEEALEIWRSAPLADRAQAHLDYLAALGREANAAESLAWATRRPRAAFGGVFAR